MKWLSAIVAKLRRLLTPTAGPTEGQCGAIALRFVYKRLGRRAELGDIWNVVRTPRESGGPGSFSSSGALMCRDALDRGFRAIHLDARYERSWTLLELARRRGVEVIVSHATSDPAWDHCSVIEGVDGETADVFDPQAGVLASKSREELLELWGRIGNEGGGHFLLAVSNAAPEAENCHSCGTPIPLEVTCPDPLCRQRVPVVPGFILGCVRKECPVATWESVSCPYCKVSIDDLKTWSAW